MAFQKTLGKKKFPSPHRFSLSKRRGLTFPCSRLKRYLHRSLPSLLISPNSACYLAAVLSYLASEILSLAGDAARSNKKSRITPRHIKFAIHNDEELKLLVGGKDIYVRDGGQMCYLHPDLVPNSNKKK
mmetsp:Transcript_18818/g.34887  ORF Transcript_18818/g.34887 Transcript_18818/m.34887 type:complete len:129 (+) Transcript_18818:162-548(+)